MPLILSSNQPHSRHPYLFPRNKNNFATFRLSLPLLTVESNGVSQLFAFIIQSLFFTTTEKNIFKTKPNLEILSHVCIAKNIRITFTAFYEITFLYTIPPKFSYLSPG